MPELVVMEELMENGMDCQNQTSGDAQPVSSEGNLFFTLPEQRLFRRFVWLTLLQGILLGITLALFGGLLYVLLGFIPFAFYPTSPIIYRLLGPLMMTSFGLEMIISWRKQRLHRQHPTFQPGRFFLLNGNSWPLNGLLLYGLFFIWGGGSVILIGLFPGSSDWETIVMVGVAVILLAPLIWQLFFFVRNRRMAQR